MGELDSNKRDAADANQSERGAASASETASAPRFPDPSHRGAHAMTMRLQAQRPSSAAGLVSDPHTKSLHAAPVCCSVWFGVTPNATILRVAIHLANSANEPGSHH